MHLGYRLLHAMGKQIEYFGDRATELFPDRVGEDGRVRPTEVRLSEVEDVVLALQAEATMAPEKLAAQMLES